MSVRWLTVTTSTDPATGLLKAGFRRLSEARHARAFHPSGVQATGHIDVTSNGETAALPLLSGEVGARLSKGIGTPGWWPDIGGIAVRLPTTGGQRWDLLMSGPTLFSARLPIPVPTRSWSGLMVSSLVPFRVGGELHWLRARIVAPTDLVDMSAETTHLRLSAGEQMRIDLEDATTTGTFNKIAEIVLTGVDDETDTGFDPIGNTPEGVELAPSWLATLRRIAYRGSRAGRQ